MQSLNPLACPICIVRLEKSANSLVCPHCARVYPIQPDGYYDLRPDSTEYVDWMSLGPEYMARYLHTVVPTESAGAIHMMRNYLSPLLAKLNISPGGKILSIGCGGGWDVETLHQLGYQAWGVDNGSRRIHWPEQNYREYLSLADALHLPFANNYFDFVFSEGVIEHIGFGSDRIDGDERWWEQRQLFVQEALRVAKPGAWILIACPNRLFPVDFYHGGKAYAGINMRFHSPKEPFLPSFGDIRGFLGEGVEGMKAITLKGFFNLKSELYGGAVKGAVFSMVDAVMGILPNFFWQTPFSPYLVVLAKKSGK